LLYNFEWNIEKEKQNAQKHKVSFVQATTVFRDPNQISIFDEDHSYDEDRWLTLGVDKNGILLVVVHTFEQTGLLVKPPEPRPNNMRNLTDESRI